MPNARTANAVRLEFTEGEHAVFGDLLGHT